MDKLAPTIDWIKKNNFWLGCGLLLLAMLGISYYQTSSLTADLEKNTRDIKSKLSIAQGIRSKKPEDLQDADFQLHPNQATKDGMKLELERTVQSIVEAWKLRVDAQKELLVFPDVIGQQKFKEVFARYNPPETFPAEYADSQIEGLLSLYKNRVPEHMINIAGKDGLRTNWKLDPDNYPQEERSSSGDFDGADGGSFSGGGFGGFSDDGGGFGDTPTASEDAARFAVLWSETNQQLWQAKLSTFQGRDDHNKVANDPTPLQCYMLQQDLWLLEALFNIIRELNGDSVSTDTSAIKQIDHIATGREGNVKLGNLHPVDARLGPKEEAADEDSEDVGFGALGGSVGGGFGGADGASAYERHFSENEVIDSELDEFGGDFDESTAVAERHPPFHELYVDANFEPIPAEEVLAVVKGEEIPEKHLELLIAKRVPVRVGLEMDERKIADFMAACANSPFAFEIQQVRINRHQKGGEVIELAGSADGAGGFGGLGGFGGDTGGGFGGFGGGDDGTDATSNFDEVESVETRTNFNVNVEFFGIVKIYNPVRKDLLRKAVGLDPIDDETSAEPSADAASRSDQDSVAASS